MLPHMTQSTWWKVSNVFRLRQLQNGLQIEKTVLKNQLSSLQCTTSLLHWTQLPKTIAFLNIINELINHFISQSIYRAQKIATIDILYANPHNTRYLQNVLPINNKLLELWTKEHRLESLSCVIKLLPRHYRAKTRMSISAFVAMTPRFLQITKDELAQW